MKKRLSIVNKVNTLSLNHYPSLLNRSHLPPPSLPTYEYYYFSHGVLPLFFHCSRVIFPTFTTTPNKGHLSSLYLTPIHHKSSKERSWEDNLPLPLPPPLQSSNDPLITHHPSLSLNLIRHSGYKIRGRKKQNRYKQG